MAEKERFNHQVRQTALITVAITCGLAFGVILLATGDWIPGGIIVVAALAGLSVEIPVISRLCKRSRPASR